MNKLTLKQQGFTIIEMAVTITIMALLMFTAVPNITSWLDNTRIRNTTESLQNGLQAARAEAVRRNQSISFWLVSTNEGAGLDNSCTLTGASASWVVSVNDPTGQCGAAPSTTASPMLVTGRAASDGSARTTVTAVQSDGTTEATRVTFNGFGQMTNADAVRQIDITGNDSSNTTYRKLRVVITKAGMVRMCDTKVTNDGDPRKCPASIES